MIARLFTSEPHPRGRRYRCLMSVEIKDNRLADFNLDDVTLDSLQGYVIRDNESGMYELWTPGSEDGDHILWAEHPDLGEALDELMEGV